MGINKQDLLDYVIIPSLEQIDLESTSADLLLLGTAELETNCGTYLVQHGGGINTSLAVSIYQLEVVTFKDILLRFLQLKKYKKLKEKIESIYSIKTLKIKHDQLWNKLVTDLSFSTVIARLKYYMIPSPLPVYTDYVGLAEYYKKYYNTALGKTSLEKAISVFKDIVEEFA